MILLELTPLSTTVAIPEMVIILLIAALIGYMIGRWITKGQREQLEQVLVSKEADLDECKARQAPASGGIKAAALQADTPISRDDLKVVEGIGPKIEKLLNSAGIYQFSQLADTKAEVIAEILQNAGPRFRIHDPQTWPEQAALARDDKWEELEVLQEKLNGGRDLA
ncbi:helix-hairpin-helix domain-containing protein [Ravibacter arvi]|uniref:Helix-hairpin-helix domain-containing protein n=1 Tax=Ravibacter arvi TaxID=2051041 RepID=A0ABP8LWT2_9BACT